jgi:hypothetical protein
MGGGSEYTLVESWSSRRVRPESDAVDLGAQADGTANLIALVELLSSESHGEPLPALVKQCQIVLHRQHPLPALRVCLVLPHRLDVRLEHVVVQVALQFQWRLESESVEVPEV